MPVIILCMLERASQTPQAIRKPALEFISQRIGVTPGHILLPIPVFRRVRELTAPARLASAGFRLRLPIVDRPSMAVPSLLLWSIRTTQTFFTFPRLGAYGVLARSLVVR